VTAQENRPPGILPSLPATGYRALFDASPLGLSVVTLDGRIVAANAALCRMLGRPQAEVVGRTFLSMTHPDDVERNRDVYRQLVDGERSSFTVEKRFLAASGDVVWARVTVALIKDEQGVPRMAAGITEDISELRAANARAQRVQGLLHEAMHSMSDAFCVFDRDFRFVYLNPQAERDLGVDAGEMIGRVLWEEFRATADTELYQFFSRCMASGDAATLDAFLFPSLDRWFELRAHPSPQTLSVYFRDITQRRRAEQQAIRTQRMESLGTLAGGIAHDLNNVLAPILMSTELLAQGETDPRRLQLLDALVTSTNRGADMVRQVLAFARGVSGDRVEVDPADLLGGVLAIVRETFPRNIVIDCQLDQPLATLPADPTQLHQVLMNLLVNARDAMPDGGRIRCSARMVAIDAQYASVTMGLEAGDHVLIEVTDTGHGMSGDVIDRIFEPFFTTKEIGVGTGLGLSTSLAIVDSHGGHLGVYSEPGQGTTFRIHLPVGRATTTEDRDANLPHDAPCGRGETVLVVDDEPTILEVTQRGLVEAGYRVLAAPDGAEAVALFAQDPDAVDLVLTDMMMPVMDGAATVHALRTLRPDLRVIATSGLDASDHEGRTAAVGVDRVLAKPFSTATLLHAVRSVLDAEDR
jgi:PAS domain S-box-containing protein